MPRQPSDASLSSRTHSNKRKTSPPTSFAVTEKRSKHKKNTYAARPILLDDLEAKIDIEPLFVYHPVGEEAPVEASVSAGMASTKGMVLEKEEVSTATNIPMEGFFDVERTPGAVFETGSSYAIITDPMDKATTFFTRFEQVERNDFDLVSSWLFC
nr:hypothetical protein CFP56_22941 [Quercus suber]